MDKNSIFINLFIEMFLNLAFGLDEKQQLVKTKSS